MMNSFMLDAIDFHRKDKSHEYPGYANGAKLIIDLLKEENSN